MKGPARKVVAEIELNADNRARVQVGARTVYHYWPLLQSHYRGILLPPQRRTDGARVAWQWAQEDGTALPTADELKTLRRRLSDAHRGLADAWSREGPGGSLSEEDTEVLRSRLGRLVANLVSLPDRELLGFVAQTGDGIALHSWGAETPGTLVYPDEQVLSLRGRVRQGDAPVPSATVTLEDEEGAVLDQVRSDASGFYGFYKLKPGFYRVKATSTRASFVAEGLSVDLSGANRDDADLIAEDPAPRVDVIDGSTPAPRARRGPSEERSRTRWGWILLLAAVAAGGAIFWLWPSTKAENRPASSASSPAAPRAKTAGVSGAAPRPTPTAAPRVGGARSENLDTETRAARPRGRVELDDESLYAAFERAEHLAGAPGSGDGAEARQPAPDAGLPGESPTDTVAGHSGAPRAGGSPGGEEGANAQKSGGSAATVKPGARVRAVEAVPAGEGSVAPAPNGSKGKATPKGAPAAATPPPAGTKVPGAKPTSVGATPSANSRSTPASRDASSAPEGSPEAAEERGLSRAPAAEPQPPPRASAPQPSTEKGESAVAPSPTPTGAPGGSTPRPAAPTPPLAERWGDTRRLDLQGWRVRLYADAIVPTGPRAAVSSTAELRSVQERLWQSRQQHQPAWLRAPRMLAGLHFRLPDTRPAGLRWEAAGRDGSRRLTVRGVHADVGWYGGAPADSGTLTLVDASGAAWVRLRHTLNGEASVVLREGVTAHYFAAIEARPDEPEPDWSGWRWTADEGWSVPDAWRALTPEGGRAQRLDIPLDAEAEAGGRLRIRWLDTNTSWGIGGGFSLRTGGELTP